MNCAIPLLCVSAVAVTSAAGVSAEEPAAIERLLSDVKTPIAVRRMRLDLMQTKQGSADLSLRTTAVEARSLAGANRAAGVSVYWSLGGEKTCSCHLDVGEVSALLAAVPTLEAEARGWMESTQAAEGREAFFAPRSCLILRLALVQGHGVGHSLRCQGSASLMYPLTGSDVERLTSGLRAGLEVLQRWSAR